MDTGPRAGVRASGLSSPRAQLTQWLVREPTPAILVSMTSPGFRSFPLENPTPSGVPVKITSPGENVRIADRYSTRNGTEKISCEVVALLTLLTVHRTLDRDVVGIIEAVR